MRKCYQAGGFLEGLQQELFFRPIFIINGYEESMQSSSVMFADNTEIEGIVKK